MADYEKGTSGLGKGKKAKKELDHIVTKKAKTGGVVHTHHFTNPEHAPETHVTSNDAAMVQHMMQNMGSGDGSVPPPASPDGGASNAQEGAPAAAPTGAPGPVAPPGM